MIGSCPQSSDLIGPNDWEYGQMEEMTFTAGDHLESGIGQRHHTCERNTVHSTLYNYHSELFKEICEIFTETVYCLKQASFSASAKPFSMKFDQEAKSTYSAKSTFPRNH